MLLKQVTVDDGQELSVVFERDVGEFLDIERSEAFEARTSSLVQELLVVPLLIVAGVDSAG